MNYPVFTPIASTRETVDRFLGLNCTPRAGAGEFREMENLTGEHYPVLAQRPRRGVYASPASPQGLISRDGVCYVDGTDFVMGLTRVKAGLSTEPAHCPKELISMGAWVIILPDKVYVNTADPTDFGPMEAFFTSAEAATISLCRADGRDYTDYTLGDEPAQPENGQLWVDTSQTPHRLRQWSESAGAWVDIPTTYLRIQCPGIGRDFRKFDGVELELPPECHSTLTGSHSLWDVGEDYAVITGILDKTITVPPGLKLSRRLPTVDYLVECGNRLWGCRYGIDEHGEFVNRIYASALGDFRNWNSYLGTASDSYYANVGSEGPFTGAVNYRGEVLLFKENCLHRVWGSHPGEFRVLHSPCMGVESGSHRSLVSLGGVLYYKTGTGICAYDGSQPRLISQALGETRYTDAVAGSHDGKLFFSMRSPEGQSLLVYDTRQGFWHREDDLRVQCFCTHRGSLYAIDEATRQILRLRGPGEVSEGELSWFARTAELGLESPHRKRLAHITLRLQLQPGAEVTVSAEYDHSGSFEPLCVLRGDKLRSFAVPIRPRRCDHLRLELRGRGGFRLYSITKTMEGGSDVQW